MNERKTLNENRQACDLQKRAELLPRLPPANREEYNRRASSAAPVPSSVPRHCAMTRDEELHTPQARRRSRAPSHQAL